MLNQRLFLSNIHLALFVAGALLSGCTLELDVELEPEEKVLAAYAFISCGSESSAVIVEPSISFEQAFDLDHSKLNGPAWVQLFRQGQLWAEYGQLGSGVFYSANHSPVGQEPVEWEMVASHPEFGEGRAKVRPPFPGTLLSASLKTNYPLPDGSMAAEVLEVRIQDPPGVHNYYEIGLLNGLPDSLESVMLNSHLLYATSDTAFSPTASLPFAGRWLISDEAGDGQVLTLAFSSSVPRQALSRPWLHIRYVPDAYYNYVKSLAISGGLSLQPFQPNQRVYSNFENIFGLFALYVEERVEIN